MAGVPVGVYNAKVVSFEPGKTANNSPFLSLLFEITDGEQKGKRVYGEVFLTEKAFARSEESLRACGWDGKDLTTLDGLGTREARITVESETFVGKDGNSRTKTKVKWINGQSKGLPKERKLDASELRELAIRYGRLNSTAKDDDIPF